MLVAICDDEIIQREELKKQFADFKSSVGFMIREFTSGERLLDSYNNGYQYDIVLLDIKMFGMDGMNTARKIREIDRSVVIIFITNLSSYAIQGYDVNALSYILKPVTPEKFNEVMSEAVLEVQKNKQMIFSLEINDNKILKMDAYEIVYVESYDHKVFFHMCNSKVIEGCNTMAEMELRLVPLDFLRIHKSYLVNMRYVSKIDKTDVTMSDSIKIPLSRRRQKYIYDKFTEFLVRCC